MVTLGWEMEGGDRGPPNAANRHTFIWWFCGVMVFWFGRHQSMQSEVLVIE